MALFASLLQHIEDAYLPLLERLLHKEVILPQLLNLTDIHRILLLCSQEDHSEFLLASPGFQLVRKNFPQATIGVLVHRRCLPLAEGNENIDELLVFDGRKTLRNLAQLRRRLLAKWDMAVVLTAGEHPFLFDLFARFTGARFILGPEEPVYPGCKRNFFYSLLAPCWKEPRHRSQRVVDILRYIGLHTDNPCEHMHIFRDELEEAREKLDNLGLRNDGPLVAIHPGAPTTLRRWPVGRFAELARRLHEFHQAQVLIVWEEGEETLRDQLCGYLQFKPLLFQSAAVRETAAVLHHCDAAVGNDSEFMHLAAAVHIPVVAIFGPQDPAVWKPWGAKVIGLRGEGKNTGSLPVDTVYDAVLAFLPETENGTAARKREQTLAALLRSFDISEAVIEKYDELISQVEKAVSHPGGETD